MAFNSRTPFQIISLRPLLEQNRLRQEEGISEISSRLQQLSNLGKTSFTPSEMLETPTISESPGYIPYVPKGIPIPSMGPMEQRDRKMPTNQPPMPEPKPQEYQLPQTPLEAPRGNTLPPGKEKVKDIINLYADMYGVNPRIATGIANIESSLNPQAKAKSSSASGLYQIIDSTWKKYGGGDRFNAYDNTNAAMKLIKANQDFLSERGIEPTAGATYLAHFLGPSSAAKVLSNPNAPINKYVSSEAMKANNLKNITGKEMLAWATNKMNYSEPIPTIAMNEKEGK